VPHGLKRFQQSAQSHFVTFTCYHRRASFDAPQTYDLFLQVLETMRRRFAPRIYGFVVMPDHVHLLLSEPEHGLLADAIHLLKLSFTKRQRGPRENSDAGVFWQKRYYDRNIRNAPEFTQKLRYIHRNPVKRGLVTEAGDWKWSSFRHYAWREKGVVEIESEWTARERERQSTDAGERVFVNTG